MATVSVLHSDWGPIDTFRQTYHSNGKAGRTTFVKGIHPDSDYVLLGMNDKPNSEIMSYFRLEQRILIVMENPSIWEPNEETLRNAGIIVSPFPSHKKHDKSIFIQSHPAIPWFYGIEFDCNHGLTHKPTRSLLSLDDMIEMKKPHKQKILSMIVSGKNNSPGYVWRHALAKRLKEVLGPDCDIYGFGHNPVPDKRVAIDPYYFTIVIENESADYYWTEKLSDAYLGFAYPIYAGDRRVREDFTASISTIDFFGEIDASVKKVTKIISRHSSDYDRAILENRQKILFDHNLFYMLDNIIQRIP